MKSTKDRRESGRVYNKNYDPEVGAYNRQYWDDWNDHRDGCRNAGHDGKKLTPKFLKKEHWGLNDTNRNDKLNKLLIRRRYKKKKKELFQVNI